MLIRVVLAAIIGGALMFGGGAASHMVLDLTGRHMKTVSGEKEFRGELGHHLKEKEPSVYLVPGIPPGMHTLTGEEKKKAEDAWTAEFKKGPNALIISQPAGIEPMTMMTLCSEGAANIVAALLAAIIVSLTRPSCGFACRWIVVFFIGLITWVSVNASYHIWYHFPQEWVLDELYCAMIEWGLAAIAIAGIVKPKDPMAGRF